MKNCMFFGTSILDGFWEGFGRVLGRQNPRFLHFFRCFFEAFFKQRFGKAKIAEKVPNIITLTTFWDGPAECAASGERLREGSYSPFKLGYKEGLGYRRSRQALERIQHALPSLREDGGTRRAFRRPHLGCLEAWGVGWKDV